MVLAHLVSIAQTQQSLAEHSHAMPCHAANKCSQEETRIIDELNVVVRPGFSQHTRSSQNASHEIPHQQIILLQ